MLETMMMLATLVFSFVVDALFVRPVSHLTRTAWNVWMPPLLFGFLQLVSPLAPNLLASVGQQKTSN